MKRSADLPLDRLRELAQNNPSDPIRFYRWPILGRLYHRRVEMCLSECRGGQRVLEVGFGIGLTFPHLATRYQQVCGIDLDADVERVGAQFREWGIETDLRNGSVLEMPYASDMFDTVLLISILEHLQPAEQEPAMREIRRVLKPGGQVVYGVPVERPAMVLMFRLMGVNIRKLHFSTERDVSSTADRLLERAVLRDMRTPIPFLGAVYQVGHYLKPTV